MKHTQISFALLALLAVTALIRPATAAEFAIHDGDQVVFLGDSITDQRLYTTVIEAYTLTRFPQWKLSFRNAGQPGGTAQSELGTVSRDVLPLKPTFATIDFGMNDHQYKAFQDIFAKTIWTVSRSWLACSKAAGRGWRW